jgi:hypothetical protein
MSQKTCIYCEGTGQLPVIPCPNCKGTGQVCLYCWQAGCDCAPTPVCQVCNKIEYACRCGS